MFEVNSYAAQSCRRMRISRAYPYGGVHSYTLCLHLKRDFSEGIS